MFPKYSYPPFGFLRLAPNVLFGGHRSFRQDGRLCIERIKPPLRVYGEQNIPRTGPCLITFNHYYRPGFDAWWMALGIASLVPVEMHWVMTGELTFPGKWYAPIGMVVSRWLLKRISHVYGHTTMPPMPPRPKDVEARARSVRETIAYVRQHPQAVLGLAPEGGDQPGGVLNWPSSGAGRFVLLLADQGFSILPVGAFEENGEFCLSFGKSYLLQVPGGIQADEKDRKASEIVMKNIACLVPTRLRGQFA